MKPSNRQRNIIQILPATTRGLPGAEADVGELTRGLRGAEDDVGEARDEARSFRDSSAMTTASFFFFGQRDGKLTRRLQSCGCLSL